MNILVSGGAGFIGSHIVDALLEKGHSVSVVDNLSTGRRSNINPNARFHEADIRDAAAVRRILEEGKVDVVYHQAAQMDVRRSVADPAYDASVNILGLLTLMEAGVRSGVRRVVFASSGGAIYGEQETFPAAEHHPTRPISPYGVAKLASERYLYYYHAVYGTDVVCLRYANVYGPRQNPEGEAGVVAVFTSRLLRNDRAFINGDGLQTRDYVFVGDVVQANVRALTWKGFATFNIGTGIETDVVTLFRLLRTLTGSREEETHAPAKKGEQLRSVIDASAAAGALGWSPLVTLDEGLARTVEYFRREVKGGA